MTITPMAPYTPKAGGFRPNPAETIEKGIELGTDFIQQDLFALSAGVSDVKSAAEFAKLGGELGSTSWQKGAYAVAGALSGSPASGLGLVQTVESLFSDPVARGFFSLAGALAGSDDLGRIKDTSEGYGTTPAQNGLIAMAAAVAGPDGAQEAINVGLSEGRDSREGSFFALATALVGGVQELGSTFDIARDFASDPILAGPYAVAAALAGEKNATSALRMADDLGQSAQEKSLFAVVGGLLGAERAPGFIRMSRALSPDESQVGSMAIAAALTAAEASPEKEAAAAALALLFEPGSGNVEMSQEQGS